MRFIIEEPFRALFPEAHIGVVIALGTDNRRRQPEIERALRTAVATTTAAIHDEDLAAHPAVAPWREAYRRFGVKPSRYRSSIESLLRSARAGPMR